MAGATTSGLAKSHARMMLVRRLSQRPLLILASVLALSGATIMRSAHFRRSMCTTGSPFLRHVLHSSSSLSTVKPFLSRAEASRKPSEDCVATTLTSAKSASISAISTALMVATLPVTPSIMWCLRCAWLAWLSPDISMFSVTERNSAENLEKPRRFSVLTRLTNPRCSAVGQIAGSRYKYIARQFSKKDCYQWRNLGPNLPFTQKDFLPVLI
mmetsp:Transcript_560/g.1242  ORF Transcript_560/g.1242 Transcript_560/m.1242 type:complete len:213 (+) Transcript_560:406-1044(+)